MYIWLEWYALYFSATNPNIVYKKIHGFSLHVYKTYDSDRVVWIFYTSLYWQHIKYALSISISFIHVYRYWFETEKVIELSRAFKAIYQTIPVLFDSILMYIINKRAEKQNSKCIFWHMCLIKIKGSKKLERTTFVIIAETCFGFMTTYHYI